MLFAVLAACSEGPLAPARGPLADTPADLAAVAFTAQGTLSSPYVMLEIRHAQGFRGFVAIDEIGAPVWYFRTEGSPSGATRRRNGNFVFLDNVRGLLEVTPEGEVVRQLEQQARPGRFIHHDVASTRRNTVLFIAEDARTIADTLITGDAIWEWFPERNQAFLRWSTFGDLVPEVDRGPRSVPSDWIHANSVSIGPTGRVLVSSPFLNQILGLSPDFERLDWRLGGVRATLPVDDPFSGQHTATEVAPGRVLVFDNGFERTADRFSRAVEYELRDNDAVKVWEWRPEVDNWSTLISSARRLPSGNTLVGFGMPASPSNGSTGPIEVYEVTPTGQVMWHLELSGQVQSMYRATPLSEF